MTFWDRWARAYDRTQRTNRRVSAAAASRAAAIVPLGARAPDCAGLFSLAVSGRARQVLCTDLSLPMLDQARKKAARRGLSNIVFAQRDLLALPEGNGAFDAVIAANVLHLLDAPERAVRELRRVTGPGGIRILPTYLQGKTGAAYGTVIKICRGMGFHCEHAFTPESCRAFLERLNLGPIEPDIIPGPLPVGLAVLRKPDKSR